MKAAVFHRYGAVDQLEIENVPRPGLRAGHVIVSVDAISVNPKDTLVRKGRFKKLSGTSFPQITGYDFAGIVEEVAVGVTHVGPGDRVYGYVDNRDMRGATAAEYASLRARQVARAPESVTASEAAALPCVSLTALQALRDIARLAPKQKVLIHGASGGVGTAAVQIAASVFDTEVFGLCSPNNHEAVRGLGAEHTLDYRSFDISQWQGHFDVFFDIYGNQDFARVKPSIAPGGRFVTTVPSARIVMQRMISAFANKKASLIMVRSTQDDLSQIADWVERGVLRPIVDTTYAFNEIRRAHEHVETKHTRGKVVVEIRR